MKENLWFLLTQNDNIQQFYVRWKTEFIEHLKIVSDPD